MKKANFELGGRWNQGFTLVEMLVVIALIALIGTFVTAQVTSKFARAKVSATKIQMKAIAGLLDQFKLDCNFYPTSEQGLEALLTKPAGRECKNYDPDGYVGGGKLPTDAWDNDFIYFSEGRSYSLKSLGADGEEGGEEDDSDLDFKDI